MLPHEWTAAMAGTTDTWKTSSHIGCASTFHVFNDMLPKTAVVIEFSKASASLSDNLGRHANIASVIVNFAKCVSTDDHGNIIIDRKMVTALVDNPWKTL